MKILFCTDLHGCKWKYEKSLEIAEQKSVDVVINGGDMLPTDGDLIYDQETFLKWDLKEIFERFEKAKIYYLFIPGNDDLQIWDETFKELIKDYQYIKNINCSIEALNGYEFIGFNLVPDYPFGLKDRCRKDKENFIFPGQYTDPVFSYRFGFKPIENWPQYCCKLDTLEDCLKQLQRPKDFKKSIYVIHTPPKLTGLDVLSRGESVGSMAVREFIEQNQPLMTLHGHIHDASINKTQIGNTICIQPGQLKKFHYAIIDLSSMNISIDRVD